MDYKQTAQSILEHSQPLLEPNHDYRVVNLKDFTHLDHRFYKQSQSALEARGFTLLVDIEDATLTNAPSTSLLRVCMRVMISNNGHTLACIYHTKRKQDGLWSRFVLKMLGVVQSSQVVEFMDAYHYGAVVSTSNAELAAAITQPPLMNYEYYRSATSLEYLYERHTNRIDCLKQLGEYDYVTVHTSADLIGLLHQIDAAKAAYRAEHGTIAKSGLEMLNTTANAPVDDIYEEMERLRSSKQA